MRPPFEPQPNPSTESWRPLRPRRRRSIELANRLVGIGAPELAALEVTALAGEIEAAPFAGAGQELADGTRLDLRHRFGEIAGGAIEQAHRAHDDGRAAPGQA